MNDFLVQFLANLLATLLGGAILYFLLEKQVRTSLESNSKKLLLKGFIGDLSFNLVTANKILDRSEEYTETDKFTLSRYRIEGLLKFYYQKPYLEEKGLEYEHILSLIKKFEDNNRLADLVYSMSDPQAIKDNKREFINNTKLLLNEVTECLKKTSSLCIDEKIN